LICTEAETPLALVCRPFACETPVLATPISSPPLTTLARGSQKLALAVFPCGSIRTPRWRKVRMLPARSAYPPELNLWGDTAGHWLIAPANDMLLLKYGRALDVLSIAFLQVK
jgi:hypothetical protein